MIERLIDFLGESPVNFLAVDAVAARLKAAGFRHVPAEEPLPELSRGSKIYVTKNGSAIFAAVVGTKPMAEAGFHIICAHSDSPTFRIKPNAEMLREGMLSLNTEVYGGAILSTWFDRPLSLAGRAIVRGKDVMHPDVCLVHIKRPLLVIPNLAIHFNRQVNDGVKLSRQKDMLPLMAATVSDELRKDGVLLTLLSEEIGVERSDILDFDLYLYDVTPATRFGLDGELINGGRLDDLSMVHAATEAIMAATAGREVPERTAVMAIFDNEETGSQTKQGAGSPFLASWLERIATATGATREEWLRAVERSFMVSADNAHAFHPNYGEKYDPTNHPVLGRGPVIKLCAAQKYASDALSAAVFAGVCKKAGVPCQYFVNHSDCAGGSTLGNILASSLPLRGVDMGCGVLAMHSCRETASCFDHEATVKAFTTFYKV